MTTDAGALHCPNCGGPVGPVDLACRYCQSTLATVSCPSCFAMMFESATFCPACGVRRARTAGAAGKVRCPACRMLMRDVQLGPTQLLECEGCGGIWVDALTFEHVCADSDARAAVLHQWPSPERRPIDTDVHYRPCAACG